MKIHLRFFVSFWGLIIIIIIIIIIITTIAIIILMDSIIRSLKTYFPPPLVLG